MAYVKLMSPEARAKLEREHHPAVARAFADCREPAVWPPIAVNGKPYHPKKPKEPRPDDFPIKSTDARNYSKRDAMQEAQNHRCCYCGIGFDDPYASRTAPTIEHVIPRAAGGYCIWSNEVMACELCNTGRGAMMAMRYFAYVQEHGRWEAFAWGRKRQREASIRLGTSGYTRPGALVDY